AGLAPAAARAGTALFRALAAALALPVCPVAPEALTPQATHTHSPRVAAARGTGSVAEATALAAAGPGARLLAPRMISADRMASCALAMSLPEGQTQ
ncbi:MAG: cobalamin biosynthesis protein, partial [Marinovum algicola]